MKISTEIEGISMHVGEERAIEYIAKAGFDACATPDDFNAHLDAVSSEYFVACLDIGHAEMRGSNTTAAEMIRALGNRLQALHIHDNDKHYDLHQIPFSCSIDFEAVIKALREIGYSGELTMEACDYFKAFNKDNVYDGIVDLARAARKLADMYDGRSE